MIVLPDNHPEDYRWPVRGCDVFITAIKTPIPKQVAQHLAELLVAAGALSIVIFGTKYKNGKLSGLLSWPKALLAGGKS
ncbi:MAG: hypothetical protein KBT88_12205 [Gammaproteobacteria bacterium]|nr:hypothetical protein [Gammaproteobacteria bacterium]MBQ0840538.1 hypothetical protein [Gammaproteobacteria bacterium]